VLKENFDKNIDEKEIKSIREIEFFFEKNINTKN